MKKLLSKNIIQIILVVFVSIGASYVYAGVWQGAPSPQGSNNTETPINISTTDQIKTGGILSVHNFIVDKNVELKGSVLIDGVIYGAPVGGGSTDTNISIGGTAPNSSGILVQRLVDFVVSNGKLETDGNITIESLSGFSPIKNMICADNTGKLVSCY